MHLELLAMRCAWRQHTLHLICLYIVINICAYPHRVRAGLEDRFSVLIQKSSTKPSRQSLQRREPSEVAPTRGSPALRFSQQRAASPTNDY
ncbi:hypothetical protein QUB80_13330 [Chlorogloeopsis sp. ULAP01]|uniref:hypothetical protein n=1 Tax=Chlorogloeopsis sp. ULAP01 TaxID=3056483 RepID=UPI0025AA5DA7|nr:hypothetical protein [Chlorogloeopsis sp. ULAP01]MDM9381685.1 hypothetical protein [Chlorogloeopsis sp. ULAP01]